MEGVGDSERKGERKQSVQLALSRPQVPDVKLRRMGEAMEEVISVLWFLTAAFGASWVDEWVESFFGSSSGPCKTLNEVVRGLFCGLLEGFFSAGFTVGG